jgi:hypothetical protein
MHIGADDMDGSVQQPMLVKFPFNGIGPPLPVDVVPEPFPQQRTKGYGPFGPSRYLLNRQFTQPIDYLKKALRVLFPAQLVVHLHGFHIGPPHNIGGMYQCPFPFCPGELRFINEFLELLPVANGLAGILYEYFSAYFLRFRKQESQVGKEVIDIRPSPGILELHLLRVYRVTMAPALGGNNGLEMRFRVAVV